MVKWGAPMPEWWKKQRAKKQRGIDLENLMMYLWDSKIGFKLFYPMNTLYIYIYGKFLKILGSSQKSYPPNIRFSSSCFGWSFPEMMLKKNSSLSNGYNFTFSKHSTRWSSKINLLIEWFFLLLEIYEVCEALCAHWMSYTYYQRI